MAKKVLSKGPHGEEPAPASEADLTDEEVAKVKSMDRLVGALDALEFVRALNFDPPQAAFDSAFAQK